MDLDIDIDIDSDIDIDIYLYVDFHFFRFSQQPLIPARRNAVSILDPLHGSWSSSSCGNSPSGLAGRIGHHRSANCIAESWVLNGL